MSTKIIGSQAKVHWLSNDHNKGRITKDQAVLYIPEKPNKFGQVTRDSADGLTPSEVFEQRYTDKSLTDDDVIAEDIFIIDKNQGANFDYDDGFRKFCHDLYKKNRIPFDALYPGYQLPKTNAEALISYNRENHLNILVDCLKQYLGLEMFFDTKDPIIWRFKQEEDIDEIFKCLIQHRLCLYAAYTSRGKTKIGIEVAVRLCQRGGIVLVTTPITDTKKSFEENINNYHFGADRNLKVTYMDSVEFAKHSVTDLRQRADNGELIFVVLTVQDLRYGEDTSGKVDKDTKELRTKYHALNGKVNLWIRDERHAQYGGEVTSQRLANMKADYELDLTATPYNVLDKYDWGQIVSRTLLWGLKHKKDTKLPTIRIDAVSTPLSNVSAKIAAMYSGEEGFDPRKLFVRDNGNFVLESELLDIRDKMYHDTISKEKNLLSIVNDTELSPVAKNCGLWVLPEGQDGDGAADYIPALAALLNTNSKAYFIDSYTLEKECPKTTTIGDYVESLLKEHKRVIILTCGKFLTGTDIPALGHIVLMTKMNNIANFEQLLGRMIREYPGKDEVKMYCFAPAMEIGLVQGKMAKISAQLGDVDECKILDCIPLTEYTIDGTQKISPDTILREVQEHYKSLSKDRLPSASLEKALEDADLSAWEGLNTKKFKKTAPKAGVTDDNGSKVKTKTSKPEEKSKTKKTKEELNRQEQIANAIQTVMVEAKWVAYSIDNYNYSDVLNNPALANMFPEEIEAVINTIDNDNDIKDMVVKFFNDKHLAYKGLAPIDTYDDIFSNSLYKQKIGLVYVKFDLAKKLIYELPDHHKYNKEDPTILVINALNGTFPLILREIYPKGRIICAEYFDYCKDHLQRLGFEVTNIVLGKNTIQLGKGYDNMKFDILVGNPPYQGNNDKGTVQPKSHNLWSKFAEQSLSLIKPDGYLAFVTPDSWMSPNSQVLKSFKENSLIWVNTDVSNYFTVNSSFTAWILQKNKNTKTVSIDGLVVELSNLKYLPRDFYNTYPIHNKVINSNYTKLQVICDTTCHSDHKHGKLSATEDNTFKYKTWHTNAQIKFSKIKSKDFAKNKIIWTLSGYFKPFYDNGNFGTSEVCQYVIVADQNEAEKILSYLNSKLYNFLISTGKWSGFLNGKLLCSLPKLADKIWTDAELYQHFNLTQEEIDYIEKTVK
jgi:hypothetical protein